MSGGAGAATARALTMSNEALLSRIETVSFGIVTKFTPTPVPRVEVQRSRLLATVGDVPAPEPRKLIPDIPVLWPSFGNFAIWADLIPGDTVMLFHPKGDIGEAKKTSAPFLPSDVLFSPKNLLAYPTKIAQATAPPFTAGGGYLNIGDRTGVTLLQLGPADAILTAPLVKLGAATATKGVNRVGDDVIVDGTFKAWVLTISTAAAVAPPTGWVPGPPLPTEKTGITGPGSAKVFAVD